MYDAGLQQNAGAPPMNDASESQRLVDMGRDAPRKGAGGKCRDDIEAGFERKDRRQREHAA